MKYLVTLSALALTLPAIGIAQAADDERYGPDPQERHSQMQEQHSDMQEQHSQMRQQAHDQNRMGEERLTQLGEDHIKFANLAGTAIRNPHDEEIGIVSDIVLDEKGRVAAIVVNTGEMMGIGGETKALSWNDMQVRRQYGENGEYNIIMNMSQEELENLPDFEDEPRTNDKR